jgi:hypothetical protein
LSFTLPAQAFVSAKKSTPRTASDKGILRRTTLRTILLVHIARFGRATNLAVQQGMGYYPSGGLGLVLLIGVIPVLAKKI